MTLHIAGPPAPTGMQRCLRCGTILGGNRAWPEFDWVGFDPSVSRWFESTGEIGIACPFQELDENVPLHHAILTAIALRDLQKHLDSLKTGYRETTQSRLKIGLAEFRGAESKRLEVLKRRQAFLSGRTDAAATSGRSCSFDQAEASALEWAITKLCETARLSV